MRSAVEERWLRRFRDDDEHGTTLICFPHAGATASFYRGWPTGLPAGIGVMAVRYPGREERFDDPFPSGMEALAEDIAGALGELAQRRSLVLFGHCMGASVAHEVALRLQEQGCPPAALCVSATLPPQALVGRSLDFGTDEDIIAHAVGLDASRAAAFEDPVMREIALPAVRADYFMVGGYSGGRRPELDCPVHAFAGDEDPELTPEQMRGWAETTRGAFRLSVLSGGHFYLKPEGEEAALLAELSDVLDAVASGAASTS
ncbi:thioesterase II family protein [Actinacidiphila yeochonensis]|uniref:thioesterase II family protein n=1 Tax=Actinacidiphila yeochonensis TaxID=89050 RepID=UPI000559D929|nr:alpha/beta fold hydrolase [Actinacidiphila yeochonensis]